MIIQISKLHTIVSYKLNNIVSFGGANFLALWTMLGGVNGKYSKGHILGMTLIIAHSFHFLFDSETLPEV